MTQSYPHYTPYSFSGNKVIHCRELEGKEEIIATLSSDYQSWILTWDVTARIREGEKGMILYQTNDGQVLEKMREINVLEMKNSFISNRINMESNDSRIEQPNREPDRAGGTSATCITELGAQICDMSVPREFANPIPCPTPPSVLVMTTILMMEDILIRRRN